MASLAEKGLKQQHTKKKKDKKRRSHTVEDLKSLGLELLSSRAHINNLPIILSAISPSSPSDLALEAIVSLQSFFLPLLPEILSTSSLSKKTGEEEDPEEIYQSWLRVKFEELENSLIEIAVSDTSFDAVKEVALDAIMDFVKQGKKGKFNSAIYHRFFQSIVRSATSADLIFNLLVTKYFKYIDIRYFTFISLKKFTKDCNSTAMVGMTNYSKNNLNNGEEIDSRLEDFIRTIYSIISCVPPLDELNEQQSYEMWVNKMPTNHIIKKFKLKYTDAWLSFLSLPLPLDVYKEVLSTLHQNVIPFMSKLELLCDFYTRSYDIGGVISVMALSGLFTLMTRHGIVYSRFYEKLYGLLKPDVFMAKHRAVFFQLLDACLKSSYLPAYLAASFAKKLSRLALLVPPSGELVIIALIHNLLRRHPSINFLVHQQVDLVNGDTSMEKDEARESGRQSNPDLVSPTIKHGVDPFMNEEEDPLKSNAMRSSLWEIDSLRQHYCPAVSRFVTSLENDLTVRSKTTEIDISDFSFGSYATIFREEVRRRIKQCPVAFYRETPTSLYSESDFSGWSFGCRQIGIEENRNDDETCAKRQRIESC